jgi:predicted NBD/HSP70 family sugar kinase
MLCSGLLGHIVLNPQGDVYCGKQVLMDLARQMPDRKIDDPRLEEAISRLVNALHPRAIILFGSRARGEHRPESDYDLLVISDELRDYDEVYRPVSGRGLHCDVVPCTAQTWRDAALDAGGVLRAALDDGVLLYGEP